jgi:hypothetical protein
VSGRHRDRGACAPRTKAPQPAARHLPTTGQAHRPGRLRYPTSGKIRAGATPRGDCRRGNRWGGKAPTRTSTRETCKIGPRWRPRWNGYSDLSGRAGTILHTLVQDRPVLPFPTTRRTNTTLQMHLRTRNGVQH